MSRVADAWSRIATPEKQGKIIKGVIQMSIRLGLSPSDAGRLFSGLSPSEANAIAYLFSGVGDGQTVLETGESLFRAVK